MAQPTINEVSELVTGAKTQIESKAGRTFSGFDVRSFGLASVGTEGRNVTNNFVVKIKVGAEEFIHAHLTVSNTGEGNPTQGQVGVVEVQSGKTEADTLPF